MSKNHTPLMVAGKDFFEKFTTRYFGQRKAADGEAVVEKKDVAVVIALGVIWQGRTAHTDLIASAVTRRVFEQLQTFF